MAGKNIITTEKGMKIIASHFSNLYSFFFTPSAFLIHLILLISQLLLGEMLS